MATWRKKDNNKLWGDERRRRLDSPVSSTCFHESSAHASWVVISINRLVRRAEKFPRPGIITHTSEWLSTWHSGPVTTNPPVTRPANFTNKTRLNPFARSWFYNATAVRGALWWFHQSHSVNEAHRTKFKATSARSPLFAIFQFLAPPPPKKIIWVWRYKLHVPCYRLVKVSWKSVQPFPRTVVSYSVADGKKTEKTNKKQNKNKKTSVKHIRIRLIGGCVNKRSQPQT